MSQKGSKGTSSPSIVVTNPNGALFIPDTVFNVFPNTRTGEGNNNNLIYKKSSLEEKRVREIKRYSELFGDKNNKFSGKHIFSPDSSEVESVDGKRLKRGARRRSSGNKGENMKLIDVESDRDSRGSSGSKGKADQDAGGKGLVYKRKGKEKIDGMVGLSDDMKLLNVQGQENMIGSKSPALDELFKDMKKMSVEENDEIKEKTETEEEIREMEERLEKERKINEYISNEVEETFRVLDIKGTNVIDHQEIKSAYQSLGVDVSFEEIELIIESMGNQGEECITYEAFYGAMYEEMQRGIRDEDLKFLFDMLDTDADGFLRHEEIRTMYQKCGEFVSEMVVDEAIKKIGQQDDGLITFEDFKDFYRTIDEYGKLTNDFQP